jgi:hypothetical protein
VRLQQWPRGPNSTETTRFAKALAMRLIARWQQQHPQVQKE